MAVTFQQIQDQRATLHERYNREAVPLLNSESSEDQEKLDNILATIDTDKAEIQRLEAEFAAQQKRIERDLARSDKLKDIQHFFGNSTSNEIELSTTPEANESYSEALDDLVFYGARGLKVKSRETLQAVQKRARDLETLVAEHPDFLALFGTGMDSKLGYTVPEEDLVRLEEARQFETSGILEAGAERILTDDEKNIPWGTEDDTSQEGHWIGEGKSHAGGADSEVKPMVLGAAALSSKISKATHQLKRTMGPAAFRQHINRRQAARLNRSLGRALINGDGVDGKPTGITRQIHVGYTTPTGQTNTVGWKDLVNVEGTLDPVHRVGASYVIAPSVETGLRLETDGFNRPVWQPSTRVGAPDQMNGKDYRLDPWLDALAADSMPILYGQFYAYKYRRLREVLQIVFDQLYMEELKTGYLMVMWAGGGLVDAGDHPVIGLKTAAS